MAGVKGGVWWYVTGVEEACGWCEGWCVAGVEGGV